MPRYRVTITEVIVHSGTIELEAESEAKAEERISVEGGYSFEDLTKRTADVFLEAERVED
jgi:hypothetical protein